MNFVNSLRKVYESEIVGKPLRYISKKYGENIYSRDWDVLLIFDAAQYKIVNDIKHQYEYIDNVSRLKSRGSNSPEWAQNTFITDFSKYEEEIRNTHYITDNLLTSFVLCGYDEREFYHRDFDDPWIEEYTDKVKNNKGTGYSSYLEEFSPVWVTSQDSNKNRPPDIVSNKTINAVEEDKASKIISHYMMPHEPFMSGENKETSGWPHRFDNRSMLNMSDEYYSTLISNYRQDHEYIFNHIKSLLAEIPDNKKVVITSDHANITNRFFGIPYTFGHPQYITFSKQLRSVPWVQVDQSKISHSNSIDNKEDKQTIDTDKVEERLEHLGYK